MIVSSPVLSEEESAGSWERIKQLITDGGGDITREDQWGMRRLAYPIRRAGQTFLEGNYLLTRFSTEGIAPAELETYLKLSEGVLRYLLVRTKDAGPPPPPVQEAALVAVEAAEPTAASAEDSTSEEFVADQAAAVQEAEEVVAEVAERLKLRRLR
jgi:small subunit ribosomal protein S6